MQDKKRRNYLITNYCRTNKYFNITSWWKKIKFADVNPLTGNLDPKSVEKKINKKTKAICVVHYGGYPAEIIKLMNIAKKYKLYLIEDCAHALGAKVSNRFVGSLEIFPYFLSSC